MLRINAGDGAECTHCRRPILSRMCIFAKVASEHDGTTRSYTVALTSMCTPGHAGMFKHGKHVAQQSESSTQRPSPTT